MAAKRPAPQLLTIPETSERLRCSDNTVYRLIASGELPAVDIAPRGSRSSKTRVDESDIAAYIDAKKRTAKQLRTA